MKARFKLTSTLFVLLLISQACSPKKILTPQEGYVNVTGGKVWYKIVGGGNQTPIILLHGGPGVPSYYLNPLSALAADRPVIFYDQLGCGRSKQVMDTALMTVDSFVEQLEQLRMALGIEEFYLYGQSWGTMLGVDYYLKYPNAVKAMILSSPCLSAKRWSSDADSLMNTLPDSIQATLKTSIANKTFTTPEYVEAAAIYYRNFVTRTSSADIDSALANYSQEVYEYMWGPSEFIALGTLKDYDRTGRLGEIKVPALFLAGDFDEARPATVQYYQSLVPNSTFVLLKNSGHMSMQDHPEQDVKAIRDFLKRIE